MTRAIIQAGGLGTRLRPYSTVLPKPLMPIDDSPVISILIRSLVAQGITDITVTLGYLADLITAVVRDGSQWGANVTYVREEEPLGTIGPVRLVEGLDEPFLVMNGDLLTDFDFGALLADHITSGADLTIGVYSKEVEISLGVFQLDDHDAVIGFSEKPSFEFACSMGIYAFDPGMVERIPQGRFGFDDLMDLALREGLALRGHRHHGLWLDIGRPDDYEEACEIYANYRDRFIPSMAGGSVA